MTDKSSPGTKGSLTRATAIQLSGNLAYLASQLVILLALTWLTDLTTVGTYALAQAIASPIFAVVEMRLEQVRLTRRSYVFRYFFFHRAIASSAGLLVVLGLGATVFAGPTGAVLAAVGLFKASESMMRIMLAEHMRREQSRDVAIAQMFRALATSVAFVTALYLGTLEIAILSACAALLIPILWSSWSLRVSPDLGGPTEASLGSALRVLTIAAFPIGLSYYLGVVTINFPKYVIEAILGRDALALFTVASYAVVLFNSVVETTLQVIMPRLSAHWHSGERVVYALLVRRAALLVFGVGFVGVLVVMLFGRDALTVGFGVEYAPAYAVLLALLFSAVIQNQAALLRGALIAAHRGASLVIVAAMNLVVVVALADFLIDQLGLVGAGVSMALGQAIAFTGYLVAWMRSVRRET